MESDAVLRSVLPSTSENPKTKTILTRDVKVRRIPVLSVLSIQIRRVVEAEDNPEFVWRFKSVKHRIH